MSNNLLYPEEINERVKLGMGCGSQIGKGWFDLVRKLDADIAVLAPDYTIDQINEKWGGLRLYIGNVPAADSQEIYGLIHEAEDKSSIICGECGEPAVSNTYDYFIATRCKKHEPS